MQTSFLSETDLFLAREDIANFNPAIHDAKWELQKRVIIDHEVAHMWFGNLVTAVIAN